MTVLAPPKRSSRKLLRPRFGLSQSLRGCLVDNCTAVSAEKSKPPASESGTPLEIPRNAAGRLEISPTSIATPHLASSKRKIDFSRNTPAACVSQSVPGLYPPRASCRKDTTYSLHELPRVRATPHTLISLSCTLENFKFNSYN